MPPPSGPLGADERLVEAIEWQAPTFVYQGNLASFFPKSTKHVTLMFHTGATLRGLVTASIESKA